MFILLTRKETKSEILLRIDSIEDVAAVADPVDGCRITFRNGHYPMIVSESISFIAHRLASKGMQI